MKTKITTTTIKIVWRKAPSNGNIEVLNGKLKDIEVCVGNGKTENDSFNITSENGGLKLTVEDVMIDYGSCPTLVTVRCGESSFSFILRDALYSENPIYILEYEVVVISGDDQRDYDEIVKAINSAGRESDFQRFEREDEECWAAAAERNRKQYCPTWLGLARDMRIFRVGQIERFGYWGEIIPADHSKVRFFDQEKMRIETIHFVIGQGASCRVKVSRRLDDGVLPILRSVQHEDQMEYRLTMFATLENSPLSAERIRGTDYLAGYANMNGNMLSEEDREEKAELLAAETVGREEEVVCRCRIEAVNNGKTPCYTWFKMPYYYGGVSEFDEKTGYSCNEQGEVFSVNVINGEAVPNEELAVLVQPGEPVVIDFLIPHRPIAKNRANKLSKQDFQEHLDAARKYWQRKLTAEAAISIPETRIDELVKAGLLHCDIAAIGKEPDEPVAATIGWYSPIGTESAPIIQFFDSMGWHQLAERSIEFFLKRQKDDGFIQNFGGYESETGPLLWTMGEHFRYTRDIEWLKRVKPHIDKACDYLLAWRNRNKKEDLRTTGSYGLVDGKVADPQDFYHQFFLNAGTYAGLKRGVEMYEHIAPEQAEKLKAEVADYLQDLRHAFYKTLAEAPLVPTGDGSWAPFMPPWTDKIDSTALYIRKGKWFTHGSFASRGSLVGPIYLVFHEVIEADEIGSTFMLKANQSPVTVENACLSQPYYCRHDFAHLQRGEVKAFLKTYYNQLTGLIDQETYTFWEHYYHASQHKTHEEGWFLMQTRWMLYLEAQNSLKLFSAIPRKWLEPGKEIKLNNVVSYFGKINAVAKCAEDGNKITCHVKLEDDRKPETLIVRLPVYDNRKPKHVVGGDYDSNTETVTVKNFTGNAEIELAL